MTFQTIEELEFFYKTIINVSLFKRNNKFLAAKKQK